MGMEISQADVMEAVQQSVLTYGQKRMAGEPPMITTLTQAEALHQAGRLRFEDIPRLHSLVDSLAADLVVTEARRERQKKHHLAVSNYNAAMARVNGVAPCGIELSQPVGDRAL